MGVLGPPLDLRFRLFDHQQVADSLHDLKRRYDARISSMLRHSAQRCHDRGWITTDVKSQHFEKTTGHPVYRWWFDTQVDSKHKANVSVTLESETDLDPGKEPEFVSVVHCLISVSLGDMGSDYVNTGLPTATAVMENDEEFEAAFKGLEDGARSDTIANAIQHRVLNEGGSDAILITCDSSLAPEQVTGALTAFANYFRACGGVGLSLEFESQEAVVEEINV
jgi:hypothetical protein